MNDRDPQFTHFTPEGRARMVSVGEKPDTQRSASAEGKILLSPRTCEMIRTGGMAKGDVLAVAQIAGIMAAKKNPELIPLCHPIPLTGVTVTLTLNEAERCVDARSEVWTTGKTGVEMEALTAVSVALLTVYDMCKALQKDMTIDRIRLVSKSGGVHGDYCREDPRCGEA